MASYEHSWKADFGHEISRGFHFFQIRQKISEKDMESLIRTLSHPNLQEVITRKGDMDRPSGLIKALLSHPRMIPAYYLMGKAFARSKL
jgi:hypothetical protein